VAAAAEQLSLGLSPHSRVARLERLRLAYDVVMAYEVSVIPAAVLPRPESIGGSLYEHRAGSDHLPVRAAAHPHDERAGAAGQPAWHAGGPGGLFITRVDYLESGRAVELTHSCCRSDHYAFVAPMRRFHNFSIWYGLILSLDAAGSLVLHW
jgi:GntR family transcriptional regulator